MQTTYFLVGAIGLVLTATPQRESPAPRTVQELMVAVVVPASNVIFEAQAEPPANDAGWAAVQKAAGDLAESGRALMRPPLGRDDAAWKDQAELLVRESVRTSAAAAKRDADALLESGDGVYVTCKACHDRFMRVRSSSPDFFAAAGTSSRTRNPLKAMRWQSAQDFSGRRAW